MSDEQAPGVTGSELPVPSATAAPEQTVEAVARPRTTEEEVLERRVKVLEYRKAGASLRSIAKKVGVTPQQVAQDLKSSLDELHSLEISQIQQYRALEASRVDDMFFAIWSQAKQGIPVAIDLALKLMERRAKLFGLDAAVKVDVMMQEEMQTLLERLGQVLSEEDFKKVLAAISIGNPGE